MKRLVLTALVAAAFLTACSKDDDKKCDSCDLSGEKVEMCDNGDGTYTISYAAASDKITQEDLDAMGLTAKQYVESICALGALGQ